jgi:hypothetical protein
MDKRHKNALYKAIQSAGLPIDRFQFLDHDELIHWVSIKDTDFRFTIISDPNDPEWFDYYYSRVYGRSDRHGARFDKILELFERWLKEEVPAFLEEMDEPDLWKQVKLFSNIFGRKFRTEETQDFTPAEKQTVRDGVSRFQYQLVSQYNPTQEQLDEINERLDYLVAAVDRLNKFDWKGLAIQTIISIAVNLSVDTASGQALMILLILLQQALGSTSRLLR